MWFEDLTPYEDSRSVEGKGAPALNVGWLDGGHSFPVGTTPPAAIERLRQLVERGPTHASRGPHFCDLCVLDDESRASGDAQVRVVGADGTIYAAPSLIEHYVTAHRYRPPQAFLDALVHGAGPSWELAWDNDLCVSCAAKMRRFRSTRGVVRVVDGNREPAHAVLLECESCDATYSRSWRDENPLPAPVIQITDIRISARVPFAYATTTGTNHSSEDRAEVFESGESLIVVVADGAGGMHGGAVASDALVQAVRSRVAEGRFDPHDVAVWTKVLEDTDSELARLLAGETTAVVVVVGERGLVGVSSGDSEAWVVSRTAIDRLTEHQTRKRIGSGKGVATSFHRRRLEGTLVVATDGLFNYAPPAAIAACTRAPLDLESVENLGALPRLPSGEYPDDSAAVVVRST